MPWNDNPMFPGATLNLVGGIDSMSLTGGVQKIWLQRLAERIAANGNGIASWTRCGTNGASWNYAWPSAGYPYTAIQDFPLRVAPALRSNVPTWLLALGGTNGIALGLHSAATEIADFQTWAALAIAAGQSPARTVIGTMIPRSGDNATVRANYNSGLVSAAQALGFKVARFDQDPYFADTSNLLDGVHPPDAGQAIFASLFYAQMFP